MNSRWMDIPKYHILIVNMADTIAELSEYRNGLMQVKWSLAETFPGGDVVRGLTRELNETTLHLAVVEIS